MLVTRGEEKPRWKPVLGAEVLFAPIDRPMLRRARRAALASLGRDEHEGGEAASAQEQLEDLGDALSFALIMEGARDWRDVARQLVDDNGDPLLDDEGNHRFEPLEFSADNLAAVLADPITFDAFDAAYVVPFASRERAKNGFAASPNGTGAAATRASDIASSRAKPKRAVAAKRVHTGSTLRRTKRQKVSGTS